MLMWNGHCIVEIYTKMTYSMLAPRFQFICFSVNYGMDNNSMQSKYSNNDMDKNIMQSEYFKPNWKL